MGSQRAHRLPNLRGTAWAEAILKFFFCKSNTSVKKFTLPSRESRGCRVSGARLHYCHPEGARGWKRLFSRVGGSVSVSSYHTPSSQIRKKKEAFFARRLNSGPAPPRKPHKRNSTLEGGLILPWVTGDEQKFPMRTKCGGGCTCWKPSNKTSSFSMTCLVIGAAQTRVRQLRTMLPRTCFASFTLTGQILEGVIFKRRIGQGESRYRSWSSGGGRIKTAPPGDYTRPSLQCCHTPRHISFRQEMHGIYSLEWLLPYRSPLTIKSPPSSPLRYTVTVQ